MNNDLNIFRKSGLFLILTIQYCLVLWLTMYLYKKSFLFIIEKNGFWFYLLVGLFLIFGNWFINFILKDSVIQISSITENPFPKLTFIIVCILIGWKSWELISIIYSKTDFSIIRLFLFSSYMIVTIIYSYFIFSNTIIKTILLNTEN